MKNDPTILLTFDIEEFDLPLEYNIPIPLEEQFETGRKGLASIEKVVASQGIQTTMFITGRFALQYPVNINELSAQHEIASHSFSHTSFEEVDLLKSRLTLETITGKPVTGLRMPRMKAVSMQSVIAGGYEYDSSINPTNLPGRYNNRHLPRVFYKDKGMLRLPISVTPNFRIPLFWLSFKNFPYKLYKKLALQTLRKDSYLSIYFHNWEFTDVSRYPLPAYVTRHSGNILIDKLNTLIIDLKKEAEFASIENYIKKRIDLKAL